MGKRKIYVVQYGPAPGIERRENVLVAATSPGRAQAHVFDELLAVSCEYAEQETLARLVGEGVKIQEAKED